MSATTALLRTAEIDSQDMPCVLMTTVDSAELAERMATECVRLGLAACVQVEGPIQSVYHWEGRQETAREWRLQFKTLPARAQELVGRVRDLHGYDTPELLIVPVSGVSADYLAWMRQQCGPKAIDEGGPDIV